MIAFAHSDRADLYTALAEALAEPAQWMCLPGREWPLFELASRLLPNTTALPGLALVQDEPLSIRQARYADLCGPGSQTGQPRYWLYESAFLTGRILGESTFAVARCFAQAGLQVADSELPDGASQELAFLAHLAANDPAAEKDFLKKHAALWLPALGQALARGSDPVYAAIGQLLSDWLTHAMRPPVDSLQPLLQVHPARLPVLGDASACSLCGFCAQRCPSAALTVRETATQTALILQAAHCTGCGRCATVCDTSLISMQPAAGPANAQPAILRLSERVPCKSCGQPMVSRAELDFVIKQIGYASWLEVCPACRMPAKPIPAPLHKAE